MYSDKEHCERCGDVLFKHNDEWYCPECDDVDIEHFTLDKRPTETFEL